MTRVAINGFGRIGRNAFKLAFANPELQVVAINDLTDTKTLAHLLKHDSNYGEYHHDVSADEKNIIVDGHKIAVTAVKDPAQLPWKAMDIDVVIESTGRFTHIEDAGLHLKGGAKRVVVSAAVKGDDNKVGNYLIGVNDEKVGTKDEKVFSNQSCTTNCITPIASVIEKEFGIEKSLMTTVHAYTASQALQDAPNKDLREGRNAAENTVPTTTNATVAATKILPSLRGNFLGLSIRVPVPVVSIADFTMVLKKKTTVEELNKVLKAASETERLRPIIGYTDEELVSSDYIGNSHSAIVDSKLTQVVGGNLVKIVAWYDNEWGYSNRLVELTTLVGRSIRREAR
ncbi:type I glyceraldehyde-3-phosphate dehydrogenase [bacterium]|nr:type I glyceraldehyde-3-phosphate dehydrogenase [bacterium]